MNYSNVIVFFLLSLLGIFIFIVAINFTLPLKLKSDFDDLASSYHMLVQLEGGLSTENRSKLVNDLNQIGIENVEIRCASIDEVRYGERFDFYVSGELNIKMPNKFLVFEKAKEKIKFQRISFSKKLVN